MHEATLNPTFTRMREFFPRFSIASVDGKQHLSGVRKCLVLSSDFHCKEYDGFRVVPVHTIDYDVSQGHCWWSPACPGCTGTTQKPNCSVMFLTMKIRNVYDICVCNVSNICHRCNICIFAI